MQKGCKMCGTQFEATNNRAAYCSKCIKERRRVQDKRYKQEARTGSIVGHKCVDCTTIVTGTDKKCDSCRIKSMKRKGHNCMTCSTVIFGTLKYCDKCREGRKVSARDRRNKERRSGNKPVKTETNKKYLTRGKLHFEGLGTL